MHDIDAARCRLELLAAEMKDGAETGRAVGEFSWVILDEGDDAFNVNVAQRRLRPQAQAPRKRAIGRRFSSCDPPWFSAMLSLPVALRQPSKRRPVCPRSAGTNKRPCCRRARKSGHP